MAIKQYSNELIEAIKAVVKSSKIRVGREVNNAIIQTYWQIGKLILDKESEENINNQSSRELISNLSKELTKEVGKGYSRSNLTYMRLFYDKFQSGVTLSHQLTWSHYIELLKIEDSDERGFYLNQSVKEKLSVRELRRQRNSSLYLRLLKSNDKEGLLELSKEGQVIESESDIIKDPYVLEFLNISETETVSERELEGRLLINLQKFLLELGKGFAFISSQYRITLNNRHHYVDLVFYHRILKCFVLIDLKIGEVKHQDVGQINMYLNYFKTEENVEGDNEPIGIILAASKDDIMVEYATGGLSNKVFVSKYQTYLPDRELLMSKVRNVMDSEQ